MGFQPEYGKRLVREYSCEGDLPYYRLVTRGEKEDTVKVADDKAVILLGVSVPTLESFRPLPDGGRAKRKGYHKGEYPDILHTGVGYVELGDDVGAWTLVTTDKEGKAIPASKIDFENRQKIAGTIMNYGKKNDIVRLDLDRR